MAAITVSTPEVTLSRDEYERHMAECIEIGKDRVVSTIFECIENLTFAHWQQERTLRANDRSTYAIIANLKVRLDTYRQLLAEFGVELEVQCDPTDVYNRVYRVTATRDMYVVTCVECL